MSTKVEWSTMAGCFSDPAFLAELDDIFDELPMNNPKYDVMRSVSYATSDEGLVSVYCSGMATHIPGLSEEISDLFDADAVLHDYCSFVMTELNFPSKVAVNRLDGSRIMEKEISVIALPHRSMVEVKNIGIAFVPQGEIPFTFYRHEIPEGVAIVPLTAGRDDFSYLKCLYFVGPRSMIGQQGVNVGEIVEYKNICPATAVVPSLGGEMYLSFSEQPLGDEVDIPSGVYSVGHCLSSGRIKFRISDEERIVSGDFNAGDLFLLDVQDPVNVVALAVKYPGIDMVLSSNMYKASRRKKVQMKFGKGERVSYKDGNFRVLVKKGLDSLPVSMPTMFGTEMFTQGFVTGTVDVVQVKSKRNDKLVRWAMQNDVDDLIERTRGRGITHDHYVPYWGTMISRTRPLFMPDVYIVSAYVGDRSLRSKLLTGVLKSGVPVDSSVFSNLGYKREEVTRIMNGLQNGEKLRMVGSNLNRRIEDPLFEKDFYKKVPDYSVSFEDKVFVMLRKYKFVAAADIFRELAPNSSVVAEMMAYLLFKKRIEVDFHSKLFVNGKGYELMWDGIGRMYDKNGYPIQKVDVEQKDEEG